MGIGIMEVSKMKILLCDDSILVRKKMKQHINSLGCFNVFEAVNGIEAVNMYKENNPDLVFMDIVMPEKTGVDALKDILAYNKKAKVVMASSVGTQNHLKVAIETGAYDFLQKPIDFDSVTKIVTKVAKEGN